MTSAASAVPDPTTATASPRQRMLILAIGAVGVVYGDVGTSPLYTLREAFGETGRVPISTENVLGILSLIFWAVAIVISGKYIWFILRADNRGEGGIMALTALALESLGKNAWRRAILLVLGLLGAALFYGDSLITPAISILSAVEGLRVATPRLDRLVMPAAIAILICLFALQGTGKSRLGALIGPVTVIWFVVLGVLGLANIARMPRVLLAIDPRQAIGFCAHHAHGLHLLAPLSAVVLALTGAETIYECLGQFGRQPIRATWFSLVMPGLLLNYFGQGALILADPDAASAPFFLSAPAWGVYPLIVLSVFAAVIASQAVISATYTITHQAIQLGFLPRLVFRHTSATEFGQIYLPNINRLFMLLVILLVAGFRTSSHLAHAYGIAVTGTMLISTLIGYTVARCHWKWPWHQALPLFGLFLVIDLAFLVACATKIATGGWVPLFVALLMFTLIQAWREGRAAIRRYQEDGSISLDAFLARQTAHRAPRVAGTAVFLSASPTVVPSALLHNLKHNKVLHERVVLLTVMTDPVPTVPENERITVTPYPHAFYRVVARFGFMDSPSVPDVLAACAARGLSFDLMQTSFFLGRDTLVRAAGSRIPAWRERVFFWLWRNSSSATDFFSIPANRVIELGGQVEI